MNGTPDGKGGVKTGAFPTLDAAIQTAGTVLPPTMLVASGGGVHPYYVLEHPFVLGTVEDRERAARLVQGFQARLRREAQERFGAGLDSTHDLARVLRPPGSVNGKGEKPRPVELLACNGPRYTIEQLEAEAIEIEEEPRRSTGDTVPEGAAQECSTGTRTSPRSRLEGDQAEGRHGERLGLHARMPRRRIGYDDE